jgi:hypothetical protein
VTKALFLVFAQTGKRLIFAQCLKASCIWPDKVTCINLANYLFKLASLWRHANSIAISLLGTYRDLAAETSHSDDGTHKAEDAFHILDG